jgi:hypothetical protein
MSKLVPERRTDKNGRTVTRHVLPVTKEYKSSSRIPAPMAKKQDRESLIFSLGTSISTQMGFAVTDQNEWYEIQYSLEEYSDKTLARLHAAWQPRTQVSSAIALMVYHGESEAFLGEFAMFGGMIPDDSTGMHKAMSFVRALHHYPQLPQVDDYSTADEKTKQACRGLMALTSQLMEARRDFDSDNQPVAGIAHDYDNYNTPVIQDEGLVQLVVDRPEDAQRIAEVAIARVTTDAQTIISVMDYDIKSLSSGVL